MENIDVRLDSSQCTRINHLDVFRYFLLVGAQANTFLIFQSDWQSGWRGTRPGVLLLKIPRVQL